MLLDSIGAPDDVKRIAAADVSALCREVRSRIVEVTLKNGGHMASSLGAVELITALLRVFDPSSDRVVFDVGHQAYAWKILTGRNARFDTLRCEGGLNGFPRRDESQFDHFGAGHSSTSLSAALGFAVARDLRGEKHHVVAVIGDGALINGEAFEALNHAGSLDTHVIFILNDNAMSISPRVGGMALHLARLSTSSLYKGTKSVVKTVCRRLFRNDRVYHWLQSGKNAVKKALLRGNLFADMGLTYWGPFDGHDEPELERVFELAKNYDGPLLIHVVTKKGKGYAPAENDPVAYHGVPRGGVKKSGGTKSWSAAAAENIERLMKRDERVVALTPAMADGSGLCGVRARYPERFFDVGIAEEHMITFAAGLAAGGQRPVACIYSTFLQRAVDQLVHDVCLQNLPVILAVDRAGLVGDDGETHQGLFDANWASTVPNLTVWSPFDEPTLTAAFDEAAAHDGPSLIRYPRGAVAELNASENADRNAQRTFIGTNSSICLVAYGASCAVALQAADSAENSGRSRPAVLLLNRINPLPDDILDLLRSFAKIIVVEESYRRGGVGERLSLLCGQRALNCCVTSVAIDPFFVAPGTQEQQRRRFCLTPEGIVQLL
jgi:1-deoxy-D-xylulose-5-phosphate synthase